MWGFRGGVLEKEAHHRKHEGVGEKLLEKFNNDCIIN